MPKRYEVVGTAPILDHQPGETFTAEIPPEQEKFLVGIGGLRVLGEEKAPEFAMNRKAVLGLKADDEPSKRR